MSNTVRLHRIFRCPADVLYRAMLDPRAIAKWYPPNGYVCEVQRSDARVGGEYHMSFTNFRTGESHGFGGKYTELVPAKSIRFTDRFDDQESFPGEINVTVAMRQLSLGKADGTELTIVQEGLPAAIPAESCYPAWQQCLVMLGMLVEECEH
jgi:uncharacterized protein YndB with AHSA1/START domain